MSGAYATGLNEGIGEGNSYGSSTTMTGRNRTAVSIGQLLDLYIVHLIMTFVFVAGGIILMDKYGQYTTKAYTAWDDIFYALGGVTFLLNAIFVGGLIAAWINGWAKPLSRQDDSRHWLHGLSIFSALFTASWGILAMVLSFGTTFSLTVADQVEVAGFFMVFMAVAYSIYLVVRYIFNMAGKNVVSKPSSAPLAQYDPSSLMSYARAASGQSVAQQPFFSGGGGAAAFGGLDLSGFQPSSLSTVAPTQRAPAVAAGYGGGYAMPMGCQPMMMQQPMMMMPQPARCSDDEVQITG